MFARWLKHNCGSLAMVWQPAVRRTARSIIFGLVLVSSGCHDYEVRDTGPFYKHHGITSTSTSTRV